MTTLPTTLTFTFGDWTPPPALAELDGTELAWVENHGDDAVELLLAQFRDKPNMEAVLRALCAGVQDVHDGIWQVLTETWLDTAIGVQLDLLGKRVALPRAGWVDETYRRLLKAQILVLRSDGNWVDAFAILAALGIDLSLVTIAEEYPAAFRITLGEPLQDITGADVFRLLERARPKAVRQIVEFPAVDADETFTWADGDTDQASTTQGWADDAETVGGFWADALGSTEGA